MFTARVVQLMGRIYNWDSKRMSSQVLAVVKDRYWGLPWYWPKVVLLDGSYPCDIAMEEGKDYLVSGRRERYGVLGVAVCSRTQFLETAQLDLRTLDGSHCAGPGGTIVGHVYRQEADSHKKLAPDVSLVFRDQNGKAYTARSDKDGIYELQHLAPGTYVADSRLGPGEYVASGGIPVAEGMCGESNVDLRDYIFFGRVPAGIDRYLIVSLIDRNERGEEVRSDYIQPDGTFYFRNVPDGEYLLALRLEAHGANEQIYFPGTTDRKRAKLIRVQNHRPAESLDLSFSPESLPIVPIPVALDPPIDSGRFSWRVDLLSSNNLDTEGYWTPGQKFTVLYGVRGWSYDVRLYGYSKNPAVYEDCIGQNATRVVAHDGLGITRIGVPNDCR